MRGNARVRVRVWYTLQRSYHRATRNLCPIVPTRWHYYGDLVRVPTHISDPILFATCYHIANLFWMHQLESNDAFWRSFTFIVVQLMYDLEERGGMLRAIFISHACETGVVRQAMGQKRCSWYCTGQHNASHRGVLCYDRKLADWKVGETDEGGHRAVFERPEKAFYWRGRDN